MIVPIRQSVRLPEAALPLRHHERSLRSPSPGVPRRLSNHRPQALATETNGHKHYPDTFFTVWRSLGLAEWDRHIEGKTSEPTDRSLRDMLDRQSGNGAFVSHGEVEIPHITTDFELTVQAARALSAAPGWLAGLKDAALLARVAKMKQWLRTAAPKNDFDRILKLQLAHDLPELVPQPERDAALASPGSNASSGKAGAGGCIPSTGAITTTSPTSPPPRR